MIFYYYPIARHGHHRTYYLEQNTFIELTLKWWAHWDSNPEPKDYAYHFGFRRRLETVRGLDHAFAVPRKRGRRVIMVSTPSRKNRAWIGVGSHACARRPFTEFTPDWRRVSPPPTLIQVLCSNR